MEKGNKLSKAFDLNLISTILLIAWPVILEMSLNTLVGIADTIMVSKLINTEALAAVGFANQIVFPLTFIFASFNTGATAMIARYTGEGSPHKVEKVLAQNLLLNIILGSIISVVLIVFGEKLLLIFDTPDDVRSQAYSYLKIVSITQVAMFINFSLTASFRGAGDTKTSLKINGLINIINIVGNYMLITGFLFFPVMGIRGAALSTALSRVIGSVIFIYISLKGYKKIHLNIKLIKLTKDIFSKLFELSLSAGIEQTFMQLSFTIGVIMISSLSTTSEGAFQILLRIESISFMPAIGLSIAASTLVGQSLGAKDIDKATNMGFITGYLGIIYGILIGLIFFIFPRPLLYIFTNDIDVVNISENTLRVAGFNQWALALIIIMGGALRGAGDTKAVMYINIIRLWLFQVPINYFMIFTLNLGIMGFWLTETIVFLIFIVVFIKRFKSKKWVDIKI